MRLITTQRGDTIIEVMVAFTVFAMVAIGALTVMNQGTAGAQNTLETTLVRQQVDNQAEMIRYLHQAYLANPAGADSTPSGKFRAIVTLAKSADLTEPSAFTDNCTPGEADKRFIVNGSGNMINDSNIKPIEDTDASTSAPYAQLDQTTGTSYGLWVEPILSNESVASGTAQYIDFHIRACWEPASSGPMRTLGTIVRLYVPDNVATGTAGAGAPSGIPTTTPSTPTLPRYELAGSSANMCWPHNDVERADAEGVPAMRPIPDLLGKNTSGSPPEYQCMRSGTEIYSCVNYDAQYRLPSDFETGNYKMIIKYADADCGNPPLTSAYQFRTAVYTNGNNSSIQEQALDAALPGVTMTSNPVTLNGIDKNTTIQIRWWNNHFFDGIRDPDFVISSIILEKQP